MHFPFLFLLMLGSDLREAHTETWPNPRWPPHISIQNYLKSVLTELKALWFALVSCHSMSMNSRQTSYDCTCFGSERYEMFFSGLRKRVTRSSELVIRRTNHYSLSRHFVLLLLLHWNTQEHQDMIAGAESSPCCISTDVTSMLWGCKEEELSNTRITKATVISLLLLICSQVSALLVTVGPNFTCQTAPTPIYFKFCGGSSQKKPLRKSSAWCLSLGLSPASYFYLTS